MFDGDYDILYKDVRNVIISGKTLENHIVSDIKTSALSLNEVKEISAEMPQLNISVPVNIDKWNTEDYTPLVAVVPFDYDDKTAASVKAYDADGNIHWLDANNPPTVPVVVVGTNERTKFLDGKIILKHPSLERESIYIPMPAGKRHLVAQSFNDGEAGGGLDPIEGGGGGGEVGCSSLRYDGNWEYMYGLTFPGTSLQDTYEDWVLGAPEIRISISKPIENFTKLGEFLSNNYEPRKRADVNGKWEYYG